MLKVVPVTNSAKNTPRGGKQRRCENRGRRRERAELEQQHGKHQHDRQRQHDQKIAERFLLLLVGAAVNDANRSRNVQIRHGLLHQLDALAQAHAFEAARNGHTPLQVLANDLGLAGFILKIRQRAERRGLAGRAAGDQSVPDLVQGRACVVGEAHANGVGVVVHHHWRSRRLTLQDRAGVELDLLGSEAGPRGDDGIDIHHNRGSADGVLDAVLHVRHFLDLLDAVGRLSAPILPGAWDPVKTA